MTLPSANSTSTLYEVSLRFSSALSLLRWAGRFASLATIWDSILQGVISRVDCNPPYWDSGINYIQASADTAGGSSGSPVITQDGSAVALVSGGYMLASTDIYLPLDLPLRTLQALRLRQITPRGTIQSIWILEKPADCHARGLSYEEIQEYSPDGSGLLVAREILPHGPSDGHVEEADILRTVDDQIVTSLLLFEQLMDGAVGNTLKVQVQRRGNAVEYELQVQNLWTLTPCRLLEFAGSVFQDLRYQTALRYHVPIKGVIIRDAKGPFILEGYGEKIIRSLDNQSTPNLDAFIEVARRVPDQAKVAVEYRVLGDSTNPRYQRIIVDRHWLRENMVLRSRKDEDIDSWYTTGLGPAPSATPMPSQAWPTKPTAGSYPIVRKIMSNMVEVHAGTPYETNGADSPYSKCMGFVINANDGFVITARSFMPSTLCILHIVFADSIEIPATKVYDHALGFTVIRYDTSLIEGSIGSVSFSPRVPKAQDKMTTYGPNINGSGLCPIETKVTSIGPLTGDYECENFYHPINVDVLHFKKDKFGGAGVLLDEDGDLQGLWLPFYVDEIKWVGVQLSLLLPAFEKLQEGILPPECRMLETLSSKQFIRMMYRCSVCPKVRLPPRYVEFPLIHPIETVKAFPGREFIRVKKLSCSHQNSLEAGDIIVKRGKNLVTQMSDLCDMFIHKSLRMSVIRRQVRVDVNVPTITVSSRQSDRVVWFAGARVELPYSPVPFCTHELYSQIFVTSVREGSPADMYRLHLHHFVTRVQGVITLNFDDFIEEIKKLPDGQFCQFELVDRKGVPETVQLMPNRRDFKTTEARCMEKEPHSWQFQEL